MKQNIIGNTYGKLTVIEVFGKDKHYNILYKCMCECGNTQISNASRLKSGKVKSCGCLRFEQPKQAFTKHGLRKHPLYTIWADMKQRCTNVNCSRYEDYGGRGISIYSLWKKDFKNFYNWAITNGYESGLTIDRIDNDGDYAPSNCRWVDRYVQGSNKRNNHIITIDGESKILFEWCREYNISPSTVCRRIKRGWSEQDAITIPTNHKN